MKKLRPTPPGLRAAALLSCLFSLISCKYQTEGSTTFTIRVVDNKTLKGIPGIAVQYHLRQGDPRYRLDGGQIWGADSHTNADGDFRFRTSWKERSHQCCKRQHSVAICSSSRQP